MGRWALELGAAPASCRPAGRARASATTAAAYPARPPPPPPRAASYPRRGAQRKNAHVWRAPRPPSRPLAAPAASYPGPGRAVQCDSEARRRRAGGRAARRGEAGGRAGGRLKQRPTAAAASTADTTTPMTARRRHRVASCGRRARLHRAAPRCTAQSAAAAMSRQSAAAAAAPAPPACVRRAQVCRCAGAGPGRACPARLYVTAGRRAARNWIQEASAPQPLSFPLGPHPTAARQKAELALGGPHACRTYYVATGAALLCFALPRKLFAPCPPPLCPLCPPCSLRPLCSLCSLSLLCLPSPSTSPCPSRCSLHPLHPNRQVSVRRRRPF